MNWNEHSEFRGRHAVYSPSSPSWINYSPEKLVDNYYSQYRKTLGTEIHEFASAQINLIQKIGSIKEMKNSLRTFLYRKYYDDEKQTVTSFGLSLIRNLEVLPKEVFETTKSFVNDAIGFKMNSEQPLVYSAYFAGTADAIRFKNNELKIFDLKTGSGPVHVEQLLCYAALFCLEYNFKPSELDIELRIYQMNEVKCYTPAVEDIVPIMDKIKSFDKIISEMKAEEK